MPTITVKNIPADVYALLKESAQANRRSLNSEIITLIERGVKGRKVHPEAVLARARALRKKTQPHPLDEAMLRAAKQAGRP